MEKYIVAEIDLTKIADAIRNKIHSENSLTFPNDFINSINSIEPVFSTGTFTVANNSMTYDQYYNGTATKD